MKTLKSIGNLLFSDESICLFCRENRTKPNNYICEDCSNFIEFVNRKVDFNNPNIENMYYSVLYNRLIRKKLHAFKFQGKNYLYKAFGEILLTTIHNEELNNKVKTVAFVPSHRRKKALRGYNQSELLAKYVSEKLDMPLLKNNLIKTKRTEDQNKLGRIQRRNNLKNAFKSINIEEFKDKEILLIDDIITTGSTMEECSKTLIKSGAKKVYGLAITSSMKL